MVTCGLCASGGIRSNPAAPTNNQHKKLVVTYATSKHHDNEFIRAAPLHLKMVKSARERKNQEPSTLIFDAA